MRAVSQLRIRNILLWAVLGVLWVGMYPAFDLSKMEAGLLLLSLFFFLGVQKFLGDAEDIKKAPEFGLAFPATLLPKSYLKWLTPTFLFAGIVCIALFAYYRMNRQ